jgi:hypothetical protein
MREFVNARSRLSFAIYPQTDSFLDIFFNATVTSRRFLRYQPGGMMPA